MNAATEYAIPTEFSFLELPTIEDFRGFLHPLTEFADDPKRVRPLEIVGFPMPEPFRGLLVHESDMTSTLERYHRERPRLEVLARSRQSTSLFRQVLLRGERSGRIVEYGAIRIELERLEPQARWAVLEGRRPLGGILADHRVSYTSSPQSFFGVEPGDRLKEVLGLDDSPMLYGRKNLLKLTDGSLLAEVVEILPPERSAAKRD